MKHLLLAYNKKYLLGLLILLIPTICPAQSAESNNYYRKGIEYVSSEDYINAINAFKMCQKTDTAQTPSFNLSHNWRNWVGYCYYKIGETDSAKHYTEFYRYKPYNRFEIQGLDSIYWKSAVLYNEKKNEESLHYLNEVEQRLLSIYGPSNMYLNIIWRNQALLLYPYNRPKAINILTKVWHNYTDSLGFCKTWKETGDELLSYYIDDGERDSTLQAELLDESFDKPSEEPVDSNIVILRNTKTNKVGLIQISDMTLILPMEYSSIKKIDDRFLLVGVDWKTYFIVDSSDLHFSQPIAESFISNYICETNGIPTFHSWRKFIGFNGKVVDCPISFNGISDDKAYFDIDSVTFCIHKDSLLTTINTIRNVFPNKDVGSYGDYQVLSVFNNDYVVFYKNDNTDIVGLFKIVGNRIEEILPCEYDEIINFFIVKGNNHYILDTEKNKLTKPKDCIDNIDVNWSEKNLLSVEYNGKKMLYCGAYRKILIDIEGNVYHLPIGMSIEKSDDGYYCCHCKENVRIPLSDIPLGKTSEYRKKDIRNWRFSIRMDWPTDSSGFSQNIRNWMSETLAGNLPLWIGDGYINSANETYTPLDMYKHYVNKTTEYFFREEDPDFRASLTDCDIYKMWEDENYITYIAGYTWYYGGAHGAENTQLVTFDKKSQKRIKAIDLFDKKLSKELQNLLYEKISKEIYKKTEGYEELEFTRDNIPIGNIALTPQGIAFQYDNYILTSFAMGAFDVIIPYDELTDICILPPMSSSAKNVFIESIKKANTFSETFFFNEQLPPIQTLEQCANIKDKYGVNSGEYLNSLILLSDYQRANGKLEIATSLAKEYAQSIKTQVGSDSKAYRLAIESLIKCYLASKKYEEAKYYSLELLRLCQNEYYMNESISTTEFSNVYLNLADAYWNVNKPDSALYYQDQYLQLNENIEDIMKACEYAYACGQLQKSIDFAQQIFTYYWEADNWKKQSWQERILNRFKRLDSQSKIHHRNKYILWLQTFLPKLAESSGDSVIINNTYDALLLSKNLLLNIEYSMRNMILSSQDATIIRPYLELQNLKKELLIIANMKNIDDKKKKDMMDEISHKMQNLESELNEKSKIYGDYTKQLQVGINDVRRNLYSDEIAVEFAISSDSIYYAIILNPKKELPTIIKLCSSTELREHPDNIHQLIWKSILSIEDNVKSIFFSPAGELYNLPIEYASNANGQFINENYDIWRLSSTREIVLSRDSLYIGSYASNSNAVLYGYLDYYADNIYSNESGKHISQDNTYVSSINKCNFWIKEPRS